MSDADLRALERRFRASGSVEDETAWIRACVQAGGLSEQRLVLAAHLGHQAAFRVLGAAAPAPALIFREWDYPVEFNALFNTVHNTAEHGCESLLRLIVALGRHLLPLYEDVRAADHRPRSAVEAAERWLVEPKTVTVEILREASWAAGSSSDDVIFESHVAHHVAELAQRAAEAAQNAHAGDMRRVRDSAESAALHALWAIDGGQVDQLEIAIAEDLLPWVLGYSDPVWQRLKAPELGTR